MFSWQGNRLETSLQFKPKLECGDQINPKMMVYWGRNQQRKLEEQYCEAELFLSLLWFYFFQTVLIVCYYHAYFSSPWIPAPHHFLCPQRGAISAISSKYLFCSTATVGTWILLQVVVSPPQLPAGNLVAFWHVLLNPFWKQLSWGAGQVWSQLHRWGCIFLLNQPLCICQVLPLSFPAALTVVYFSCSFAPVFTIDPVSHQTSSQLAECWLVFKGCPWPLLTGRNMLVPCACLLRGFIWCPTMTPCHVWRSEGKGRRCPGPASDNDLLTRFCGCRPMLTQTQNSRDWLWTQ